MCSGLLVEFRSSGFFFIIFPIHSNKTGIFLSLINFLMRKNSKYLRDEEKQDEMEFLKKLHFLEISTIIQINGKTNKKSRIDLKKNF